MYLENFVIRGGHELFGEVNISGAKNAAVAIIPAAILANDIVRIENIPNISDVSLMIQTLEIGQVRAVLTCVVRSYTRPHSRSAIN